MASNKHAETVEDIMDSLDTLEEVLAPVFASPLPDTLAKMGALERAKIQTMLAYVTQDLVYMYLKTRGIDPLTHPVMRQMAEVKKYFDKIKEAEDPAKRKLAVDKGAAKRFILNAISVQKESEAGPSKARETAQSNNDQDGSSNSEEESDSDEEDEAVSSQRNGNKTPAPAVAAAPQNTVKRKRPTAMDAYAGYGDDFKDQPGSGTGLDQSNPTGKKKRGT